MKKFYSYLFILTLLLPNIVFAASEEIKNFDVEIIPDKSGFQITEKIEYQFPSNQRRRGIFRDIITNEKREFSYEDYKFDLNYNINIEIKNVTDQFDNSYMYKISNIKNGLRVKIGNPNKNISGIKKYYITYYVKGALRFFDHQDEIYWNVTGNFWKIPIRSASVNIKIPNSHLTHNSNEHKVYIGRYGSKELVDVESDHSEIFAKTAKSLSPKEGMTISASFQKGFFKKLTLIEHWLIYLKSNIGLFSMILIPLFSFLTMYVLHKKYGKELYRIKSIVVKYEPPPGLTPAEVGALMDDKVNLHDITSIIIDLAVRGHLKIEETELETFTLFNSKDYIIHFCDKPKNELKYFEKVLLKELKTVAKYINKKKFVKVSELKNNFYKGIPNIEDSLYDTLMKHKFYSKSPKNIQNPFILFYAVFAILSILSLLKLEIVSQVDDSIYLYIASLIGFFIVKKFAEYMPRKTRIGFKNYAWILGYKEFVERVEADDIKKMSLKDPSLFERNLPYAISMGLADEWADKFKNLNIKNPNWYSGKSSFNHSHFSSNHFMEDFGSSLSSLENSIQSSPRSTGGSGSGGVSGGGSGGGGGGSW